MIKIDFNSDDFTGFEEHEDVLLDTGVLLAYLSEHDTWHQTVSGLFDKHIFDNENTVFLYVNPAMINEVTHLSDKPMKQFEKLHNVFFTSDEHNDAKIKIIDSLRTLIENEILIVLDGNKNSVLKQIEVFQVLGAADATYAAIANEYGISFLTVDNRLVDNMFTIQDKLSDIHNVYYTNPTHMTYR